MRAWNKYTYDMRISRQEQQKDSAVFVVGRNKPIIVVFATTASVVVVRRHSKERHARARGDEFPAIAFVDDVVKEVRVMTRKKRRRGETTAELLLLLTPIVFCHKTANL